ncbi:MAG: hypothetical protein RR603_03630 [Kurthia sp.]|uniref:DUF3953 domain-containing protein n=1 Tax=Kurthia zopfii TaxID=1650 RepID=A0A2U3AGK2_9BACL|nr:hypothetical protein [Kurthia zopfii]PWI23647.1 hypothetical protein DF281_02080 [Kurthia zopfii]TDR42672.1 hypothetical protein DFR61_10347 [Kurthia zopfii]STX10491.1 Uncharacterised protein [Kurthia zopfii]VEI06134.1 Uncharacterised protein [Kurthia zopfii]GEK30145.1 hypothetical protein KZO01_04540 [Kurthia zopfii]
MKATYIGLCVISALLSVYTLVTKQFELLPIINIIMCVAFLLIAYREYKLKKDKTNVLILVFAAVIIAIFTAIGVFL